MEAGTLDSATAAERRIIERPRLTKILDESNARFLLLIAPAGYGKTTLARQWLRDKPHVWYQADRSSSDPAALAKGLERAFGVQDPANPTISELLHANPTLGGDPPELAAALESLAGGRRRAFLVIDDFHLLAESELAERFVLELVRLLQLRLLVASRVAPCWLTAKALLYGDALCLTTGQLSMTQGEVRQVITVTDARDAAVVLEAEGWPVLVSLAAAGTRVQAPQAKTPRVLYEFFSDELVRNLPPDVEEVILEIALAPSLAKSVERAHPNAVAMAVRSGALGREDGELSIHPLLADFLVKRREAVDPAHVFIVRTIEKLLARRLWDDSFGLIEPLRRPDLLGRLLESGGIPLLDEGRTETVKRWLRAADKLGYAHGVVGLLRADLAARAGQHEEAFRTALRAAGRVTDEGLKCRALVVAGRAALLRHNPVDATDAFEGALVLPGREEDVREAFIGTALSSVESESGGADQVLRRLIDRGLNDPETLLRIRGVELFQATRHRSFYEAATFGEDHNYLLGEVRSPWARSAYSGVHAYALAMVGEYEQALVVAERALKDAHKTRLRFGIAQVTLHIALANLGLRNYSSAARALRSVDVLLRPMAPGPLHVNATILSSRLLMEQHLTQDAIEKLRELDPESVTPTERAELRAATAMAYAIVHQPEAARKAATSALAEAPGLEARTLAQAAIAAIEGPSHLPPAVARALLDGAATAGTIDVCVFALRVSSRLRAGIESLRQDDRERSKVADELLALARPATTPQLPLEARDPGLSPREQEVIRLVAQGLKNRQIAGALFISEVTVKAHLRHIFKKLGIQSRTAAAVWYHAYESDDASEGLEHNAPQEA